MNKSILNIIVILVCILLCNNNAFTQAQNTFEKDTILKKEKTENQNKSNLELDEIIKAEQHKIDGYYELLKKLNSIESEKKQTEQKIKQLERDIENEQKNKILTEQEIKKIETTLKSKEEELPIISKKLESVIKKLSGEISFEYKNEPYIGFIADLSIHSIQLHLYDSTNKKKFLNINNLKHHLESECSPPLMITNAGMYTRTNDPEGLLIINNELIEPLDIEDKKELNFYMKPNGVFYIDNNKAFIVTTEDYVKLEKEKKISPDYATQSGPMLLISGRQHPDFNYDSNSKKLRSGVGILPDGRILFIISKNHNTNFHTFATIFKDVFLCKNALFLDGEISKMYLKSSNNKELNGYFGPMFSVTERK
jgi:uncharacterized protein YigE (DUF2233 family)